MRGICFVEPLFYLVPEKIKTQTRRIITPPPEYATDKIIDKDFNSYFILDKYKKDIKPFYKTGEILYLKEPYRLNERLSAFGDIESVTIHWKFSQKEKNYENDMAANLAYKSILHCQEKSKNGWINKLFVPNYFSSDFPQKIKITNVKCEKLQDISEKDCIKEGIYNPVAFYRNRIDDTFYYYAKDAYAALINKIHGKGTWESNPFVWVYDFEFLG